MRSQTIAQAAAIVAAAALGLGGAAVITEDDAAVTITTETTMGCNDWPVQLPQASCFAAGTIRYTALYNLQGAAQFCKWRAANPGEWQRLKTYAAEGGVQTNTATWLGASILNELEAYFALGAPAFVIAPNNAPNRCKTPTLAPPVVAGVTPGQTDATVTIETDG